MALLWEIIKPGNALLLALCVGTLLLFRKKQAMAKVIIIVAVASFLAIAILPVGTWLLIPLENRFQPPGSLPHNVRGIIVLGGAFENKLILARRQLVLKNSGERILTFFQLAKQYPKARLIFAGGSGSLGPRGLGDSLPAKPFFDQMGIDFGRVILEERARSTYENALFSRQLVSSVGDDQWVLITSAWHMPRAFGALRKAGWAIIPYPVDFRTDGHYNMTPAFDLTKGLGLLSLALKEWGALAYYRLRGWSDALFPASQDRADKL